MYNLVKIRDDWFEIHNEQPGFPKSGYQLKVLVYMTSVLGFDPDELQFALLDLLEKDNDTACFGINRTFIYSYNSKDRKAG